MRAAAYVRQKDVETTPAALEDDDAFAQFSEADDELDRLYNDVVGGQRDAPMAQDDDEDDADDELALAEEEEYGFEQVGLPTRAVEEQELGRPKPRSTCFGCVYVGEREQTAIPYRDVMDLIEMGRSSMGCSDPVSLAKEMARRYRKIRQKCNANLQPGERALPEWTAATILEHIRCHNQDPELQQWRQLRDIQELKEITMKAMVVRNKRSREEKIDEKQFKVFNDLVRLEWFLYKQDPQKARFYSGGGHIEPKTLSQGILCTSGKPIVDLWHNRKRKKH